MLPQDYTTQPDYTGVVWNSKANRFYDTNTGKIVSNLVGIQTLQVSYSEGFPQYIDQAGNIAPDPIDLKYKGFNLQFMNVSRDFTPVAGDAYEQPAPSDGYHVSLFTYIDNNGKLAIGQVNSKIGQTVNFDDEQRRIAATIASELGIPFGAQGSDQVLKRATAILHYTAQ